MAARLYDEVSHTNEQQAQQGLSPPATLLCNPDPNSSQSTAKAGKHRPSTPFFSKGTRPADAEKV